jgi:hypothetical protein
MPSSDNTAMETSASAPDYTQMILEQLQQIRLSNEDLQSRLARQESAHMKQLDALKQDFEARFASFVPAMTVSSDNGGNPGEQPVPTSSSSPLDPKSVSGRSQLSERLPDPPMFTGKKKDLSLFLTKLRLKLRGNADRFPDEASRVIYAHSRLDADPATLINPLMESDITSVDKMIQFLEATYGDPNKELTAWSRLDNLKQGKKNFTSHFANFRHIIADANLNESAQISQLRRTLSDNIREKMAGVEIPDTLDGYANLIQRYDNDLRYLPSGRSVVSSKTTRYPVEMEIDAAGSSAYAPKHSAERQKRVKEGRCFKCGEKGHISTHCPSDPKSKQHVRTSGARHHDQSESDSDSDSYAPSRPSQSRGRASRSRSSPSGKGPSRG